MEITKLIICAVAIASIQNLAAAKDVEKSTQDLSAFIGKWEFVDESTKLAGFDYREEGTLHCYYAYEDAYIRCDGKGNSGGKKRTYSDFLNYNSITDQYEWLGIFGNHPEKAFFVLTVSQDGQRFEMRGRPMNQRDGTTTQTWAIIQFDGDDGFKWNTYLNRSTNALNSWPLSFVGEYKRVD